METHDPIGEFVKATEDLSLRDAAALAGVSHTTVGKWKAGERPPMLPATRQRIAKYLAARDAEAETTKPPTGDPGRLDLKERLASAEAEAGGDIVRLAFAYDALAATIRAEAQLVEARAAEARAVAMGEAEQNARLRSLATTAPSEAVYQQIAARVAALMPAHRAAVQGERQDPESTTPRKAGTG